MEQLTYTDYKPTAPELPLWLLMDDIETPRNAGTIFRLADTLGAEGLVLCGKTPSMQHRLVGRTARGADRHVPSIYFTEAVEAIEDFRNRGYTIVALEITNESKDVKTVDFTKMEKMLLIAGSESKGISQAVLDRVDVAVHIPTAGYCLSMNVAMSVAIAVYEISRQWSYSEK